ncbi:HNH endonuclease [Streptomyces sp. H10-C2]|uniref:HNH endonuclease n=1 Tax=Streptomyces TaxID=1883 RepID=UPI0018E04886|nr:MULTISPECIES: HNH endonuclease [Streptomyces]MDJ0344244.1 HNH endonuclease [Streptomyces sp. PH10-H1]MDJ0373582.1 HNH endonuclease [Streptomyces sp. H10-C2]
MRSYIVVTSACWVYTGGLSDDGYGRFWAAAGPAENRSDVVRPSRWMWAAHHGPIPDRIVCRHRCDLTICVRPECLELGDQVDNLMDAARRDRITNLGRVGKADRRGAAAAAGAIRTAILEAVGDGMHDPVELASVVSAARAEGDPYGAHQRLF